MFYTFMRESDSNWNISSSLAATIIGCDKSDIVLIARNHSITIYAREGETACNAVGYLYTCCNDDDVRRVIREMSAEDVYRKRILNSLRKLMRRYKFNKSEHAVKKILKGQRRKVVIPLRFTASEPVVSTITAVPNYIVLRSRIISTSKCYRDVSISEFLLDHEADCGPSIGFTREQESSHVFFEHA